MTTSPIPSPLNSPRSFPSPSVGGSQSVGGSPPPVVVHPVPDSGSVVVSNPSAFVAPVSGVGSASQLDASQVAHAPIIPSSSSVQDLLASVGLGSVAPVVHQYVSAPSEAMSDGLSALIDLNERRTDPYDSNPLSQTKKMGDFLDNEYARYQTDRGTDGARFEHLKTDTGGAGGIREREAEVAVNFENYVGGLARPMIGQYGDFIGTSAPFKGVSFDHMGMEAEIQSSDDDFIASAIHHTNKEGVHFVLLDFEHVSPGLKARTLDAMSNPPADSTTGIVIYHGRDQIEWHRPCTKQPDDGDMGLGLFG